MLYIYFELKLKELMKKIELLLNGIMLLLAFSFLFTGCSNPTQIPDNFSDKTHIVNQDSISSKLPEIIVWQKFRDPDNTFETIYRTVQMDEGYFGTYDSITIEPRDTLYSLGFEVEWNTHNHIYKLDNMIFSGIGWKAVDLQCSRKYLISRVNIK